MTSLKLFLALASVLLFQLACVSSDTVNIDFLTAISNCGPDNGWSLVDSNSLPTTSKIYDNKVLKASFFSCATFRLNVSPGNLVLSVYLKVDSESRIEVLVRDNDESIINYVYDKTNIDFEQGWHTITLSFDKETTAHVTLLGFSRNEDNVIVESIKYYDNQNSKSTWAQKLGDIKIIDLLSNNEKSNELHSVQNNLENKTLNELFLGGNLESNIIQHKNVFSIFYHDNNEIHNIDANDMQDDKYNNILNDIVLSTKESSNLNDSFTSVRSEGVTGELTGIVLTDNNGPSEGEGVTGEPTGIPSTDNAGPSEGEGITGEPNSAPSTGITGPNEGEGITGEPTGIPSTDNTGSGEGEGVTGEPTGTPSIDNTGPSDGEGVTGEPTGIPSTDNTGSGEGEGVTGEPTGTPSIDNTGPSEGEGVTGEPNSTPSTDETGSGDEGGTTKEPTEAPSIENYSASFWNVWTIALVAVASGTLVALIGVGTYYLGKNSSGNRATTIIDLSDFEAPRIIPRAKTAMPPYQKFGGSDYGYNTQRDL